MGKYYTILKTPLLINHYKNIYNDVIETSQGAFPNTRITQINSPQIFINDVKPIESEWF